MKLGKIIITLLAFCLPVALFEQSSFIQVRGAQFTAQGNPYYFIGINYWYGGLLGLEKSLKRGKLRLQKQLDFLKRKGVTNLHVVVDSEGIGLVNGITYIGPPIQTAQGKSDHTTLSDLDISLATIGKFRFSQHDETRKIFRISNK